MNKLFIYISFIFTILLVFTRMVSAIPEASFRKIKKEFTLFSDSTVQMNYYKELEINSLMALNNLYGETFIIYNPDFQKLNINYAFTRQANGDTLFVPENALNEVLPAFAKHAPEYNHLKEMVVTHTGLEPGACIYLNYTLLSHGIHSLDIDEILQEESPVREYQIVINIPYNQEINYKILNLKGKPEITQTPYGKRYSWTFKNLPPRSHEPFRINNSIDIPHFIANTYNSNKASLEIFRNNFHFDQNEEIAHFTKELIRNSKNDIDKVFTIKDYITNRISTLNIPLEYLNWKIRTPEKVFHQAYGTQAEKINLFITMLQSVGLNASVVVIYPNLKTDSIGGLKPIHRILAYTLSENIPLFLSVDGHDIISPELRGKRDQIYLLSDSGITPLTVLPASGNIKCQLNLNISSSESHLNGNISLSGGLIPLSPNPFYQEKIKDILAIPGDSLQIRYNKITPFENNLYVSSKSALSTNQDYLFYSLPELGTGVHSWRLLPLNTNRHEKLELPYPIKESYDYIIQLAPGFKLENQYKEIHEKHRCGSIVIKITQQADKIHIHREINIPSAIIDPKEYGHFLKILNIWENKNNKTLIIKSI